MAEPQLHPLFGGRGMTMSAMWTGAAAGLHRNREPRRKDVPRLNRIIETALYVDDLDRARAFYEDKLGLAPLLKTKTLFAYDVGGSNVLLLFLRGASLQTQRAAGGTIPPHDGSGPLHIAFAIDTEELPAWEARLSELDIAVEGRMQWERGSTSLYFRDPDGHLLELATPRLWKTY